MVIPDAVQPTPRRNRDRRFRTTLPPDSSGHCRTTYNTMDLQGTQHTLSHTSNIWAHRFARPRARPSQCIMMVLFQRRIIYMPSIPPGMRNESLKEGEMHSSTRSLLGGMNWNEVEVESGAPSRWLRRKVNLKGIEMEAKQPAHVASTPGSCSPRNLDPQAHVVVLYLQGKHACRRRPLLPRAPLTPGPFRRQRRHAPSPTPPLLQTTRPACQLTHVHKYTNDTSPTSPDPPRPRPPLFLAFHSLQADTALPLGRLRRRPRLSPARAPRRQGRSLRSLPRRRGRASTGGSRAAYTPARRSGKWRFPRSTGFCHRWRHP